MNRPVLIRGMLDAWPAWSAYRADALAERFGERRVVVSAIPYGEKFGNGASEDEPLADYLAEVSREQQVGSLSRETSHARQ